MSIPLSELFDLERHSGGRPESTLWHKEAFLRAFCWDAQSPFSRVRERVEHGFSVLAFVPGKCMVAAADYLKNLRGGASNWREFGHMPDHEIHDISELWSESTSIRESLRGWLLGSANQYPQAIYHNLDLLSDTRGDLVGGLPALTFCFSILMEARAGTAVGLVDRDAGRDVPEQLRSAFPEQVRLEAIELKDFHRLIPLSLGKALSQNGKTLGQGPAWLIGSRLRWSDPIHAIMIMENVARAVRKEEKERELNAKDRLEFALSAIWEATLVSDFRRPAPAQTCKLTGVDRGTIEKLKSSFIEMFRGWRDRRFNIALAATGADPEQFVERELERLPGGFILEGPPGTGKTHLLHWFASEIGLPLREANGADLKAAGWGDAERRIRRMFREARRAAPCLLILDDSDDLLGNRALAGGSLAGAERSVVHTFLQEMAGFQGRPTGVLVALTTNRFSSLDPAVCDRIGQANCIRIPYPLTPGQVGELVDAFAAKYQLDVSRCHAELVELFFGPVTPSPSFKKTADWRALQNEHLYSARAIEHAMKLLKPPAVSIAEPHLVSAADIKRMKAMLQPSLPAQAGSESSAGKGD